MSLPRILLCLTLTFSLTMTTAAAAKASINEAQINAFVTDMVKRHKFDRQQLQELLGQAKLRQSILDAISSPAEGKPWHQYRPIFVTDLRIREGVKFWQENEQALKQAEEKYGVPAAIIVAIIGVETRYGRHAGKYRVLDSLATLAFNYPPRSKFFRSELEHFLLLTREEKIDPLVPHGSYAGAMGTPQFISSSYRRYAIDFDDDGQRDLWNNNFDTIGSVANYFSRHGWETNQPVAVQAKIKGNQHKTLLKLGMKPKTSIYRLKERGITPTTQLPETRLGALFAFDTKQGPEYWVGLKNFYVITRYNHSPLYAMAVYQLSQAIEARRSKTL